MPKSSSENIQNKELEKSQKFTEFQDEDEADIEQQQKQSPHQEPTQREINQTQASLDNNNAQAQTLPTQSMEDQFMQMILEQMSPEEAEKLKQMLENIPAEDMAKMGAGMGDMPQEQLKTQLEILSGMNAEQVMQMFEEISKMDHQQLEQMAHMDEMDKKAMKVAMEMEQELVDMGKPWRYLFEYGFYGFKMDTFTFQFSVLMVFVYVYIQHVVLYNIPEDSCQYALSGAAIPYLILNEGQYYRLFTSMFVYFNWSHIIASVTNAWYVFFMIERPMCDWRKFGIMVVLCHLGGVMCSTLMHPDMMILGFSGPVTGITVMLFFFTWKYKEIFMNNKIFTIMMGSYFIYFIWQVTISNLDKIYMHMGSAFVGMLLQPFAFNMNYKLSKKQKMAYKITLGVFFTTLTLLVGYYQQSSIGPETQELFKTCKQALPVGFKYPQ